VKIVLIRGDWPRVLHETNITGIYPPLGLGYIAAVLRKAGYKLTFLDNQILQLNGNSFKNEIKKISPDVVLLSSMTPLWPEIVKLGKLVKEISSQIIVGVGGPHLSVYAQESLSSKAFDFGVYGEGEDAILDILEAIKAGRSLDGIRGCIFKKGGRVTVNPPRPEIYDLDSLPFPAIDLLPYTKYLALSVRQPFFSMITSRGCPYNCKFCFQGYMGKYRTRSPENVVEEMDILVNKYKAQEIVVFDESFAVEKEKVLKICGLIHKRNIKFRWDIRTRVDLLDNEILESLKSAGCTRVHLGIESGDQEILCKMNKGISVSEIVEKVKLVKKNGLESRGYFMLAYPGETYGTICRTVEFAKSLPLDWASFTVTIGLPGTDIYNEGLKNGYFNVDYWREYTKGNILHSRPYFMPEGMKEDDLFRLKKNAYLGFYLRSKIIWNILKNMRFIDGLNNFRIFLKLLPSVYHSITRI